MLAKTNTFLSAQ